MALHRRKHPTPPRLSPTEPNDAIRKVSHPPKRKLLLAYAECGFLTGACIAITPDRNAAYCLRRLHYYWMRDDPDYARAFEAAHAMAIAAHEDEASRRAMGWDETQYAKDGTPYTVRKYSDTMLIFRLKALLPEKYREAARRDDRSEVSELLKAVLMELAERQTRNVTPEAEWAPMPPTERQVNGQHASLPAPPGIGDDDA